MNQYTLLPAAAPVLRNAVHIRTAFVIVFSAVALVILRMTSPFGLQFNDPSLIVMPFILLLARYLWDLRKARITASTYKLTIGDGAIIKETGRSKVTIPIGDVTLTTKCADGSYIISGSSTLTYIVIPAGIERPAELEALLSEIKPLFYQSKRAPWHRFKYPLIGGYLFLFVGALLIENKYVGTLLAAILVGIVGYAWMTIQRDNHFDRQARLLSFIAFFIVVSLAMVRIVVHWM